MDTAMRDMDQLRERGDESTGRKVGLFVMAAVLSIVAVFSLGLMVGRDDGAPPSPARDPLAELVGAPAQAKAKEPPVGVDSLSFPATLLQREDPAVEATVRAAEEEHAALMGSGLSTTAGVPPLPALAASTPSVPNVVGRAAPASTVATEDSDRLSRVARHDPLVAQALPAATSAEAASPGYEGAYTLQVVSYEDKDQAERFAKALRTRGHKAFVVQADVPGRGRFNRVRIGPFETRKDAVAYQRSFEGAEKMHTILVGKDSR